MYETTVFNTADEKTEFNSGMRLISKPRIYIPASIASCFKDISRQMTSEFSFFYKIKEQYGWDFFIDEKGFLPKQRVTGSHIEYDEPRPSFDFRCVIHRHPDGCHSFSKDDNDAINLNFDVSLIWTARDGFVRAQLNLLDDADCTQRMVIDADVWIITPQYVNKYMKKISALTYKQPEPKRIEQAKVLTLPAHDKGSEDKRELDNHDNEGKPINEVVQTTLYEFKDTDIDTPSLFDYADEVAENNLNMLMEEEELINKIMSVATEKPTGHEEIMKWVNELYGKTMSYYGDFENIIYSFVRVSLLTGMKVMAIKNQVNSMAIEWKKGQYNIPLQRVLGCEKSFMASDKYSKLVEKAIVKELK